ncbi:uncharacterized protein LOC119686368 [Teleopsis dalmanni]|uniref:uncharacterized protein LOC119686368 n=1 Tax=Teleopsis dalmanni TaxID=139649 RepID=UPI0018CD48F4|nr:uncharacterized protein LOC119686368 [Teleopsis dalmanni]
MSHIIQNLIKITEHHPQIYKKTEKTFQGHTTPGKGLTLKEFREQYQEKNNEPFPILPDENMTVEFLLTMRSMSTHRKRGESQVFYMVKPQKPTSWFARYTGFK